MWGEVGGAEEVDGVGGQVLVLVLGDHISRLVSGADSHRGESRRLIERVVAGSCCCSVSSESTAWST